MNKIIISILILATVYLFFYPVDSCNEAVCASIVSKCMLTQSCKCDLKDCSCCKECFNCLSYLYSECCSCVDICPKPNDTTNALSKKSHVEDFPDSVDGLFRALTEEPDPENRWKIYTYPIDFDNTFLAPIYKDNNYLQPTDGNIVTLNCTVLYMTQCMSWNKCKANCLSMGASSYRWFHDGCCECIGSTCINYGINESRCPNCSEDLLDEINDELDNNDLEETSQNF